jgi:ATP/maltotriose-dependent transcriptional regulator MalT
VEPPSARELGALQLIARGASNQEIAEVLAVNTVKRHVSTIAPIERRRSRQACALAT